MARVCKNYQPIENYGIIGDLETAALAGLDGSIDFMCFPGFDSPSIFAALLDKDKGGYFCIQPVFKEMKTKQLYLPADKKGHSHTGRCHLPASL